MATKTDYKETGIVTAPVVLTSVAALLGKNCKDVGTLCTSSKINKWAIYKPQNWSSPSGLMDLKYRRTNSMGLTKQEIEGFKDANGVVYNMPLDTLKPLIKEWTYVSRTAPFRLQDFLNDELVTSNGYNHLAKPCDADWKDDEVKYSQSQYNVLVDNFSLKIDASSGIIGSADYNFMPLSYIQEDLSLWYLGLAIYIDGIDGITGWVFISGTNAIGTEDGTAITDNIMPTVATSGFLNMLLVDAVASGVTTFTYVPCLLYNPQTATSSNGTYITMGSGNVYSMPSGATNHSFSIVIPISNKTISNTSGNKWYIIDGEYYVQLTSSVKGTVKYMIKSYNDTQTGRTLSGWWLVEVVRQTNSDGFQIKGFLIVFATVDKDSNIFTLAKPSLSSQSLTINYLTINYNYLTINTDKSATSHTGEASLQDVTMDIDNSVQYSCSTFSADIYGCDVSAIILGGSSYLYEAGLTVNHVLNPSIT